MNTIRSGLYSLAALVLMLATACTTTYTRDGKQLPPEEAAAIEAQHETEPVDIATKKIEAVVASIQYERGPSLLRQLQWLISQRELAIPVVVAQIEKSDVRTRAHLLYVLGFTRMSESTAALANSLNDPDEIVRFEAASGLLNHGDTAAVPVLITYLENDDRRFRYKAIEVLKKVLGQDFNYEFAAPAELRNVAVGRWRSWWEIEKTRLMYRGDSAERNVGG